MQYPYISDKMTQTSLPHPESDATGWIDSFTAGAGPRYLQIVGFLERAIADGRLRPGMRLPAQRRLATLLGVDLTTVTRAYLEAARRRLVHARGARGTYVATPSVEFSPWVDLSLNIPPPPADVDFDEMLRQGLSQVLMRSDANLLMTYHLGGGGKADREAGARWLAPMFGKIDAARVIVCPGAQSALATLMLALTRPGEAILAETLIYPGLRAAATQLGRRVETVEADDDGMRPDCLEAACRAHGAQTIYLNPTLQNPTTQTMSEQRRRDIAAVAAQCGARIIEDDPYWLLADDAPPPLARLSPGQAAYVSTLSKCLSPGLRTAFVLLPDEVRQDDFLGALRAFALMSATLATTLAAQWIHDGSAARLLAGVRAEAGARRRLAGQILASRTNVPHAQSGIHVWHTLPPHWTAEELANAARAEGLAVTPSSAFSAAPAHAPNAIRISLGGGDRRRLEASLQKLASLVASQPPHHRGIVI